nr:hypothetical protein Itr_chr01CG08660 [Ipomoea trifida]
MADDGGDGDFRSAVSFRFRFWMGMDGGFRFQRCLCTARRQWMAVGCGDRQWSWSGGGRQCVAAELQSVA